MSDHAPHSSPILIFGPTASGKSALAMALAEKLGGAVINADSMQVYAELRILTARPSADDEARVPHLLYGHVPARDAYSTGRYMRDVAAALEQVAARGLRPILVGGTGLYFKALLEGLSPVPEVAADVRAHWRGEAERLGAAAVHEELALRDPVMAARLKPADTQRIVRALEVLESSGKSLSHWQSVPGTPVIDGERAVKLVLKPERAELHRRAEQRFVGMVADGALEEARALAALGLDPALPAMRAIGVAPLIAAVHGQMAIDAAVAQGQAETRQYIKRQTTWLNSHMITWNDVSVQSLECSTASSFAFIQS